MAGWDRNADWNRDVLERVVALLFALAGLADLAAGVPARRRRLVLGFLSHGEAEARAFVIGAGVPAWRDVPESADDAARLAASFRALALVLYALQARARLFARSGAIGSQAGWPAHGISGPAIHWPDAMAPPAPDTS